MAVLPLCGAVFLTMGIGRRRFLLGAGAVALSLASDQETLQEVISTPQRSSKFHVGLVGSNFIGSHERDDAFIAGLADPHPLTDDLTDSQLDAVVRATLAAAATHTRGLESIVRPDDWVVIKPNIVFCPGVSEVMKVKWVPGMIADPRVVRSVIGYLLEHGRGKRITIAEGSGGWKCLQHSKEKVDGWTTHWNGVFGKVSYRDMIDEFSRRHPKVRFDIVDLNFDDATELAVPGPALASRNLSGKYVIPQTILGCDRLISVAAMKINPVGVSLSIKNYFGIGPGMHYGFPKGKLHEFGDPSEVMVDLFSFRPADYAVVGGCFGVEGDNDTNVHHNVLVAGSNAVAVDTVASAVMGFSPRQLLFLRLAAKKGFGTHDLDQIAIHGNSIDDVWRRFVPDTDWHPARTRR